MDDLRKPDRRIERTRALLREALLRLVHERRYEEISIRDITDAANLGRATFYVHYPDKDALLDDFLFGDDPDAALTVRGFLEHVEHNRDLYTAVLSADGAVPLCIRKRAEAAIQPHLTVRGVPGDLVLAHGMASLLTAAHWWLLRTPAMPIRAIYEYWVALNPWFEERAESEK